MYKFLPSGVFTIEPYSSGSLSGLNFSIKDNINIAQYKTSYGSPSWQVNIRLPFIRHCCKNVEVIGGVSLEIGNFCTLSALFNQSWFVRVDFASVAIAFKLSLLQYRI
ncbi:TPA: hypothetical protein MFX75_27205 [Klebsiella pneumoniae]|nr:hypothetical protein [Klebsiella pneumoniae]HBX0034160.1 hypothetical protein [Klebsiella pneumoniae]